MDTASTTYVHSLKVKVHKSKGEAVSISSAAQDDPVKITPTEARNGTELTMEQKTPDRLQTSTPRRLSSASEGKLATPPPKVPLFRLQPPPGNRRVTPQRTTLESEDHSHHERTLDPADQTPDGSQADLVKEPAGSPPSTSDGSITSAEDAGAPSALPYLYVGLTTLDCSTISDSKSTQTCKGSY